VFRDSGLDVLVSIEGTRLANGEISQRVHFHILTDDGRSLEEIKAIVKKACRSAGLFRDDYHVWGRELSDGYNYFTYFTKCDDCFQDKVILFEKGLLKKGHRRVSIQKFRHVNWFEKGRGKINIWNEVKAYMRAKAEEDAAREEASVRAGKALSRAVVYYRRRREKEQAAQCRQTLQQQSNPRRSFERKPLVTTYAVQKKMLQVIRSQGYQWVLQFAEVLLCGADRFPVIRNPKNWRREWERFVRSITVRE
jgi:hypothetical protein